MFPIKTWTDYLLLIGTRYLLLAGIAFVVWYVIRKNKVAYKKIQLKFPTQKDYQREIVFSVITTSIFATVGYCLLSKSMPIRQHTLMYSDTNRYGMWWFYLAFPVMLILHDAYFYFTHRLMHHPALFKIFHLLHHKSTNPSPWAAFAFHPLEALVEVGIVPLIVFTIPITPWHFFFFFLFQMVYNVYGHLGWELYPKGFQKTMIGKWINTSVCHNQHHQYFKGNYGLYFLWWDRWLGTIRTDYNTKFDEVSKRK
jgi:sterol desaturase/sphingolipid hydroxylase (fatty acid hydroxylase superfamily)